MIQSRISPQRQDNPDQIRQASQFPDYAPAANSVFYRTYSRRGEDGANLRETWKQVCDRTLNGLKELGNLTDEEAALIERMQTELKALPSGRWLWVGGTNWIKKPENFSGAYNCTSTNVDDWRSFGLMMDLAMMGCGTGAVLEPHYIGKLPAIRNLLTIDMQGEIGTTPVSDRQEETRVTIEGDRVLIQVGDSRQGWVKSYQTVLELASDERFNAAVQVTIDLSDVRPAGERLKGFGGMANPIRLPKLYARCATILNKAIGRQLTSVECCLLIDEAAACVVAGNIRRSAGIRQFAAEDESAAGAKENLWQQDESGNWRIDPERDVLRMANHTRVFHHKPSLDECTAAVRKQYYSGEGAIQWAGEAERRAQGKGRYGLNPCVTADTWVHTGDGPRQVKDLIGLQHSTYVNGELFSTTSEGFFYSGTKPVLKLATQDGRVLRLTGNHKVLKVTAQTQKAQYTEWVEAETLQPGDRILLHNHRGLQPWHGQGAAVTAAPKGQGTAAVLTELEITSAVEQGSYEFYCGFLQELFDTNGQVQDCPTDGPTVRLVHGSLPNLQAVQRMLGRLGILSSIDANQALVIAQDNLAVFADLIGFQDSCKAAALSECLADYGLSPERFTATVAAIAPDGVEAVYDCTVPGPNRFDANGFVAHNCGEIIGQQFHCVAGSTLLITRDGLHPIQSLVGQTVEVWNGQRWSAVVPVMTGRDRQMYRVTFGDGTWLDVTAQHRFFVGDRFSRTYTELTTEVLRDRLESHPYALHTEPFKIDYQGGEFVDPTWAYTLGQLVGDGSLCQSRGKPQLQLRLYGAKSYQTLALAGRTSGKLRYYAENPETPCLLYTGFHKNFDPEHVRALKGDAQALEAMASWNREGILHFMAGLIDADGSETPSGGVRLYLSDYERAYRLYLLLLKCGIRSSINLLAKAGSKTNLGVRQKDLWYLQITDCAAIPCQRVDTTNGHAPKAKGKWQVIRSVEPLPGVQDSFCFNEPEFHKGVFGGTLTGQCNLAEIHLNQLDPNNLQEQEAAFTAGALAVATLLNHQFVEPRYRQSRLEDPIVGVSFTGLFDFFVNAFGVEWLHWWTEGRPDTVRGLEFKAQEQTYLSRWKEIVHQVVWDYCDRHGIKRPNRCTTVQPAGTKSLLTGASPGWHPPKAQRFIRRITFRKDDPVALACRDYGYSLIPSQSDKDETGNLLNDPFDPRCTEWLVELPVEVPWANIPGADQVDISKFSALAQFDFYMQVQQHYTTHNTSATIELREPEIEPLATRIYEAIRDDQGYISAALLARFDDLQTFPRLPFEPVDKATYEELRQQVFQRQQTDDFYAALCRYDAGELMEAGPAGCDSDKCMMPEQKPG
ncbi:MAG: ribonucleoside-triphosphate reductase, adenosylcobalamin-dependent [Leptolyngbya sp. DLM2.Bin15]|nr:MAG: ribonucleoside-triphosphate reductase, adenosylcobalamin-dependent [Leptolyngbya sp. DLM2.Bin15]